MRKLYFPVYLFLFIIFIAFSPCITFAQSCGVVTATYDITESRCAATGMIQINATGGSGTYQYKVAGPVVTNYTSSSLITGLSAGKYLVTIKDVNTNCVYANDSVTVNGNYEAPNFSMATTDVTCTNGSDGTITVTGESFGRAPFSYKIIAPSASQVGVVSVTGVFTGLISGNYLIQLSDSCGAIQTRNAIVQNYDWWINSQTVTKIGCDSINVNIILKDSKGNITPNAIFNGFTYGASIAPGDTTWYLSNSFTYFKGKKHKVQIFVKDNCGNLKSFLWVDPYVPAIGATVAISDKACTTFTATITGQVNLTAPQFCIYDSVHTLITCNTTGVFTLLPYGNYCIEMHDDCYDTTISRCFTMNRPIPYVDATIKITPYCSTFTATVTGQVNLNNPNFCLYDSSGTLMYCNATGIFTGLAYGTYCIKISNNALCYDTLIIRCFTAQRPKPSVGATVTISNLTCTTFTATVNNTGTLTNPQFCLYTVTHVLIICNSTGIFTNLPYGSYCIDAVNDPACYDTTITRCFTVNRPVPAVAAAVSISAKTCTTFTATITGKQNINNAQFCVYDSSNVLVSCNTTGIFTSLTYGSYCINIRNDSTCYDTTIKRCFTVLPVVASISLSSQKSCATIGNTEIKVTISSGIAPYSIALFSPTGTLMQSAVTSSSNYTFLNIPSLSASLKYKVVVTDQCGNKDSTTIIPIASIVKNALTISPKCPSGIWPNGSADIIADLSGNNIGGNIVPVIIKKDSIAVTINASSIAGYKYTFLDMGPGTYIFDTYIETCSKHLYDTVVVGNYIFPVLSGTNAYQCDNNGFSVSVNVSGGVGPYTYEIIGSVPASPSIVTAPQTSPIFSISNGTNYSLVRLRVIDGCGNASLYDVSVLPLANFLVFADTLECMGNNVTLRVDSIANAVYTWYRRVPVDDSIVVGTGPSLIFPNLSLADTGRYFCKIVVNSGCIIKYANYFLTGFCSVLPIDIALTGFKETSANRIMWLAGLPGVVQYEVQRSDNNTNYATIGTLAQRNQHDYFYLDKQPITGDNYYRIKIVFQNGSVKYTNAILLRNGKFDINVYPNPVESKLYIDIKNSLPKNYLIEISNMMGQKIISQTYTSIQNLKIEYPRNKGMTNGVYVLIITELQTKDRQVYKLMFK